MFCRNCGKEINDTTIFCPHCGAQANAEPEPEKVNLEFDAPVQKKLSIKALVGFIVSLAGILIAALPCGIVGLIFSILGKKEVDTQGKSGKGFAIAGMVVSIFDIVFGALMVILAIVAAELASAFLFF